MGEQAKTEAKAEARQALAQALAKAQAEAKAKAVNSALAQLCDDLMRAGLKFEERLDALDIKYYENEFAFDVHSEVIDLCIDVMERLEDAKNE